MDNNMQQQNFNNEPPMTLGNWMITILLTAIPCVGLIMLLVWGFGANATTTKKNYARAMLIYMVIVIVFYVILFAVLGAARISAFYS